MSNQANSQQSGQNSAWWTRDKQQSLNSRIEQINKLNDPTTNADEMLFGTKILIYLLLGFTGLLGGISYYKNFSGAFPVAVAIFMAAALTIAIEWGKNYCASWTFRMPFFQGWGFLRAAAHNSFMYIGLVLIAAATFVMSVRNSTRGAEQLSIMLSQEKEQVDFSPSTGSIDSMILRTQAQIDEANTVKWKGVTTRESQRAITGHTKTLESLQRQREKQVSQQRSDYEVRQAQKSENRSYAANLVLASGGWVEFLQFILILLRVSCEKALNSRLPSTPEQQPGIGFQRARSSSFAAANAEGPVPQDAEPRRPIGFFRDRPVEKPEARTVRPEHSTVPEKNIVEQSEQPVRTVPGNAETIAVLADIKEWKKRCTQCFHRACNQQREERRRDNRNRTDCYAAMLRAVGFNVTVLFDSLYINIQEPRQYITTESAMREIEHQKYLLLQIGKEGA